MLQGTAKIYKKGLGFLNTTLKGFEVVVKNKDNVDFIEVKANFVNEEEDMTISINSKFADEEYKTTASGKYLYLNQFGQTNWLEESHQVDITKDFFKFAKSDKLVSYRKATYGEIGIFQVFKTIYDSFTVLFEQKSNPSAVNPSKAYKTPDYFFLKDIFNSRTEDGNFKKDSLLKKALANPNLLKKYLDDEFKKAKDIFKQYGVTSDLTTQILLGIDESGYQKTFSSLTGDIFVPENSTYVKENIIKSVTKAEVGGQYFNTAFLSKDDNNDIFKFRVYNPNAISDAKKAETFKLEEKTEESQVEKVKSEYLDMPF